MPAIRKWIVKDWAGNLMFHGLPFRSFDEARGFICEAAEYLFPDSERDREGYAEDMYAEPATADSVLAWQRAQKDKRLAEDLALYRRLLGRKLPVATFAGVN